MRSIYDFVPAPIACWRMNDKANSAVVIDELGNHHGTYHGTGGEDDYTSAHSVAGKVNTALDFDGVQDYIEIADHADFTPAGTPFSISADVYMDINHGFMIVSKGAYNVDGEFVIQVDAAGKFLFMIFDNSVANCYLGRKYNTSLTADYRNQWVHLVGTYDGGNTSASLKLYLNGLRVDDINRENNAGSFVAIENLSHALWIGRFLTDYSIGLFDNVMIFNKELTARHIKKLHDFLRGKESIYGPRPNSIYEINIE